MKRIAAVSGIILFILAAPIAGLAWHYLVNHNWRTVEAGTLYGSRQMDGPALEDAFEDYGIRTVVNFRSENKGTDWYDEEVATCAALGVNHVSFGWSKNSIPDPESLMGFIALLETGEPPFLMHCQGGTHRTGAGAAVYVLLNGGTPEQAREEFKIGFNDAPIGQLVDLYERSGDTDFKSWAQHAYPIVYDQWKTQQKAAEASAE